ncbi:MAG: Zn-ribbon containing protein [Candidatus Thermoplasmatota archaeon]|nr:Zn-ribbon containing protein [Candidatus Thermoplasmatota archaeon]
MSHQCLKCGKIFEDGSAEILKGCPVCGGKKFFYTKKSLSEKERYKLLKESEIDLESIAKIVKERGDKKEEEWFHIEPKNIKEILQEIEKKKEEVAKTISKQSSNIESISVEEMGNYRINLKRLMDDESIIIQKDGSYMIHLPSLLMRPKEK